METLQGAPSYGSLGSVDVDTKVLFQNTESKLKHNLNFHVKETLQQLITLRPLAFTSLTQIFYGGFDSLVVSNQKK